MYCTPVKEGVKAQLSLVFKVHMIPAQLPAGCHCIRSNRKGPLLLQHIQIQTGVLLNHSSSMHVLASCTSLCIHELEGVNSTVRILMLITTKAVTESCHCLFLTVFCVSVLVYQLRIHGHFSAKGEVGASSSSIQNRQGPPAPRSLVALLGPCHDCFPERAPFGFTARPVCTAPTCKQTASNALNTACLLCSCSNGHPRCC